VRDPVRVIGIRFVHMLRRKRRRQREPGRQHQGDGNTEEPMRRFRDYGWEQREPSNLFLH
jgi:hypothetical protein